MAVDGVNVELSPEKQAALAAKNVAPQAITLGVRPEHIMLTDNGIAAKVDVSEMMGSAVHLHVNDGKQDVVIVVQTMDMTGHQLSSFTSGTVINFTFNGNVAHLFNKETGKNLEF